MKLPRDLGGRDLASALEQFGYVVTRSTGSHMRLTTKRAGEHHVTIPAHSPLRTGTLSAILSEVAAHLGLTRDELLDQLFG